MSASSLFGSLIETLRELEEEGRSRAFRSDELPEDDYYTFARKVRLELNELFDETSKLADKFRDEKLEKLSAAIEQMIDASHQLGRLADVCYGKNYSRRRCNVREFPHYSETFEYRLSKVDEIMKDLIGSRCTWLLGMTDKYSLSAAINDFTACFHRIIEVFEDRVGAMQLLPDSDRCYATNPNPLLAEACLEWERTADEFYDRDLYSDRDYSNLEAKIIRNKADFTVGSAEGHRTHVDLEKKVLEYYDTDTSVRRVMKMILEDVSGVSCKDNPDEFVLVCDLSGAGDEQVKEAIKMLAAATSADFRLNDTSRAIERPSYRKYRKLDEIVEVCGEELREEGDVWESMARCEAKLVKRDYEEAKRGLGLG